LTILGKFWASTLTASTVAILLPVAARAGEQGHYSPASWSPRDLISAPAGTKGIAPYISYYLAEQARTGSGEKIDESDGIDVGANSWMFTPVFFYAPTVAPLGADWAITVVPAYGESGANAQLTALAQDITLFDNNNMGWADLYIIPANLTWHLSPTWALSAQYGFWAPVGEYNADRADNVGLGYWSQNFRGTASYFPRGNPSLLLSASVLYEINGEKDGFDLRPAPHVSIELGASLAVSERFMWGVIAGGIWETGNASGRDAMEDGRDSMLNAGAEATYWFVPGKVGTMARITREFNVRDRFEGTTFTLGANFLL
jgi:hypothetical protein